MAGTWNRVSLRKEAIGRAIVLRTTLIAVINVDEYMTITERRKP